MLEEHIEDLYRQEDTYWWHVGKRAALLQLVKKYAAPEAGARALEIGPGAGRMLMELNSLYGEAWGVELSRAAVDCCARRGMDHVVMADVEKGLPFRKGAFRLVMCSDTLEHLRNDEAVLREIHGALEPGGVLALTVPAYPSLYSYWDHTHGHKRRYSRTELLRKLSASGLRPAKISYTNAFILPAATVVRIMKGLATRGTAPEERASDFMPVPGFINSAFIALYTVERAILKYTSLPFGLSLICVAVKE